MTTTRALCVVGHTIPGRHLDGCPIADCPGCLPAIAADGLQVCAWHERRTRDGLRDLPGLWADLADPRRSRTTTNGPTGRDNGSPMLIDDARRQARSAIRMLLVAWCITLRDDYHLREPADTVRACAHHVAVHAGRLLASEHADQLVHDIESAVREARRLAHPRPRLGVTVPCPSCGHRVALAPDQRDDVTCAECGETGDIRWWRTQLAPGIDEPMHSEALCAWLLEHHRIALTRTALRQMAARGQITRAGKDTLGRGLYDPVEVAGRLLERRARTTV